MVGAKRPDHWNPRQGRTLGESLTRQRGRLSIKAMFTLITGVNLSVIAYLVVVSGNTAINGYSYDQGGMIVFMLTVLMGVLAAVSFFVN